MKSEKEIPDAWYHLIIDPADGGFCNPWIKTAPKITIWKANYHNGRASMNCVQMLKSESEPAEHFTGINQAQETNK